MLTKQCQHSIVFNFVNLQPQRYLPIVGVRRIEKRAGKCDSLPREGGGRGFCAMLLRMIIKGIIVR
jgi:hypothetical protein